MRGQFPKPGCSVYSITHPYCSLVQSQMSRGIGEKAAGEAFAPDTWSGILFLQGLNCPHGRHKNCNFSQTSLPESPCFLTIPSGGTKNVPSLAVSMNIPPPPLDQTEPVLGRQVRKRDTNSESLMETKGEGGKISCQ